MFKLITLNVIPGQLDRFETNFVRQVSDYEFHERLIDVYRTEIDQLNQAIHLWKVDSSGQNKSDAKLFDYSNLENLIVKTQSKQINPPGVFLQYLNPQASAALSEIRIYRYKRQNLDEVIERWSAKIKDRIQLSPIKICGYTDKHPICEWVHIWSYNDLNERQIIRQKAIDQKIWSPGASNGLISQENFIVMPVKFSPYQ